MSEEEYWETHCWSKRFLERDAAPPCARLATWRGPKTAANPLIRAWRACDEHHQPTDERIAPDADGPV